MIPLEAALQIALGVAILLATVLVSILAYRALFSPEAKETP